MNISILTEYGKDIGIGHLSRCVSLWQAFKTLKAKARMLVLRDKSKNSMSVPFRHEIISLNTHPNAVLEAAQNSDIMIIDSYTIHKEIYAQISKIVTIAAYLDDYNRMRYPQGIVINGSAYGGRLAYPAPQKNNYLLGPRFVFLRREFWEKCQRRLHKELRTVLITFGGSDQYNLTIRIIELFNKYYPSLRKKVILGPLTENVSAVKKICKKGDVVLCNPSALQIRNSMLGSDIAISAGGQTLYELARTGTPTIAIGVSDNQRLNLQWLKHYGFLEFAGWHNDKNLEQRIVFLIKKLNSLALRKKKADSGKQLIDGQGALRVATHLIQLFKNRDHHDYTGN